MDIQLSGTVTHVLPLQSGVSKSSGKEWKKQSYVLLVEEGQYPRSVTFDIVGEERIKNSAIQLNEQITVHLDINCNEWQGKFYNSINCWKVERGVQQAPQQQYAPQPTQQYQPQPQAQQFPPQQAGNDLPF